MRLRAGRSFDRCIRGRCIGWCIGCSGWQHGTNVIDTWRLGTLNNIMVLAMSCSSSVRPTVDIIVVEIKARCATEVKPVIGTVCIWMRLRTGRSFDRRLCCGWGLGRTLLERLRIENSHATRILRGTRPCWSNKCAHLRRLTCM